MVNEVNLKRGYLYAYYNINRPSVKYIYDIKENNIIPIRDSKLTKYKSSDEFHKEEEILKIAREDSGYNVGLERSKNRQKLLQQNDEKRSEEEKYLANKLLTQFNEWLLPYFGEPIEKFVQVEFPTIFRFNKIFIDNFITTVLCDDQVERRMSIDAVNNKSFLKTDKIKISIAGYDTLEIDYKEVIDVLKNITKGFLKDLLKTQENKKTIDAVKEYKNKNKSLLEEYENDKVKKGLKKSYLYFYYNINDPKTKYFIDFKNKDFLYDGYLIKKID